MHWRTQKLRYSDEACLRAMSSSWVPRMTEPTLAPVTSLGFGSTRSSRGPRMHDSWGPSMSVGFLGTCHHPSHLRTAFWTLGRFEAGSIALKNVGVRLGPPPREPDPKEVETQVITFDISGLNVKDKSESCMRITWKLLRKSATPHWLKVSGHQIHYND